MVVSTVLNRQDWLIWFLIKDFWQEIMHPKNIYANGVDYDKIYQEEVN